MLLFVLLHAISSMQRLLISGLGVGLCRKSDV